MSPLPTPDTRGRRWNTNRGLTLLEIMVATTLTALVVLGTIVLLKQVMNATAFDENRVKLNNDMLKLTRDLTTDAVSANYFLIFPTGATSAGTYSSSNSITNGSAGDVCAFVSVTTDSATGNAMTTKAIVYYRDATPQTAGPVRRYNWTYSATGAGTTDTIYTILSNNPPRGSADPIVVPMALGEATGDLFYNNSPSGYNGSVILKSDIQEYYNNNTANRNDYTQGLFNFSVAPRG